MSFLHQVLELLFPSACSYCHASLGDSKVPHFCAACWSDLSVINGPQCPACGIPFPSPETLAHSPDHRCSSCRLAPPAFDQALSVGEFEGSLREAVHRFKYGACRALGRPLGRWMAGHVRLLDIDVVIPVPLHRSRLRERGFNQSLLLAHAVGIHHSLPLSYDNLLRTRRTRPQVELSGDERRQNVRGAFALERPSDIAGKRIVLVDDVFTTGATMSECAEVLKQGGAERVLAFTLARAV